MEFKNTKVMNFQGAIRGLRNPLESWAKSDSEFGITDLEYCDYDYDVAARYIEANEKYDFEEEYDKWYEASEKYAEWLRKNGVLKYNQNRDIFEYAYLGPNDLNLAQRMIKAGASDRKFLRQILVSVDITAPLYWWKEADTYKVATVANSTSTMHKLASTPITKECFEMGDYEPSLRLIDDVDIGLRVNCFIDDLEQLRQKYLETKDKKYWKELIRWLPNGWLQTRTWTGNYETLRNMYGQRRYHKLTEWSQDFCNWVKTLPYAKELILFNQ